MLTEKKHAILDHICLKLKFGVTWGFTQKRTILSFVVGLWSAHFERNPINNLSREA